MRFAFIHEHLHEFPAGPACDALGVSRAGYYAWRGRPASPRHARREDLEAKVRVLHEENRKVYGSPRLCRALKAQGGSACENTVAKMMREAGIRAKGKRKFVPRTTDAAHRQPVAPNLLQRRFEADRPNRRWVADITYIPTQEGWLYMAGVLDLCSRRIVGWSMADHMQTGLVSDALRMALAQRHPTPAPAPAPGTRATDAGQATEKLMHHSDRGVQYASEDYQRLLETHGLQASMSAKGDCYDNAAMESFWATLKTELVHHERYATREQARQSIFEYVEVFYNRKRLHSSLGYLSPEAFEAGLV